MRYDSLTPEVVRDAFIAYYMKTGATVVALRQRVEESENVESQLRRRAELAEAAEAKLAKVVDALDALTDYTVQVEQLDFDLGELIIKHPIVVIAEAALAAVKGE